MADLLMQASSQEQDFEDIIDKFAPGESFGTESAQLNNGKFGKKNELIPKKYQLEWLKLVEKIQHRDMFARIEEVKRAADGGFYWRNIFDAYWSDLQFTWMQGGAPGDTDGSQGATATYPLNIYQTQGRAFMKIVGHKPDIHFVASGDSGEQYNVAEAANHLLEEIECLNDASDIAQDFARIAYTDGRYGIYTRWVADGARFGYYEEEPTDEMNDGAAEGVDHGAENPPDKKPRVPKGGEVMTIVGVPWLKVPLNMRTQHDFPWLMYSDEIDMSAAKAIYPNIANKIQSGEPGPAEYMFDRTTRVALTQGLHLVSQIAEALDQLPTIQMIWVRPCMFSEIQDEETRAWFEDTYPDGGKVVFLGNHYAESANESMDAHWSVGHAVRGHGQSTPSYGYSMLTAQDAFNDCFDLEMETHMRAIPAQYMDPQVFDMPAYSKERARPGARYPLKHDLDPNVNVQNKVFTEPQIQVTAQLMGLREWLATEGAGIVTGISPAAMGQGDENNPTLGGISLLRQASRGEAGTAFTGFVKAYSRSCEQAVRIGAKYRMGEADERGVLTLKKKGAADVQVDLVELRSGSFYAITDTDQSYPSTFEEKQLGLAALSMAAANGDLQAKSMLEDPANAETFARLRGICNVKSQNADIAMKVKATVDQLIAQEPKMKQGMADLIVKHTSEMQAQGQPVPPVDPYKVMESSAEPGPLDNAALELPLFLAWYYSQMGQRIRYDNPPGFLNVELYMLNLQQKVQAAADQAQQQAIKPQLAIEAAKKQSTPKNPTESIAFKDLGPSGKIQLGKQAGLDLEADSAVEATEESIPEPPTSKPSPRKLRR